MTRRVENVLKLPLGDKVAEILFNCKLYFVHTEHFINLEWRGFFPLQLPSYPGK